MAVIKAINHEDRLSLIEHLEELRSRLIVCIIVFIAAFSITYWQNDWLLQTVNRPLEQTQNLEGEQKSKDPLEQAATYDIRAAQAQQANARLFAQIGTTLGTLATGSGLNASEQALVAQTARLAAAAERANARAVAAAPTNRSRLPVTLGVTEPFLTTFSVAAYGALLLALPFLLYQAYAFVLPAFNPRERKAVLPLMLMVPVLFIAGVAFGYFVALPRAIDFLQNFNDDSFDILIRAQDYYKFSVILLALIGLMFQIPVGVLAVTRLGIVTAKQLAKNRGYVLIGVAVVAAVATPTPDPVTMIVTMAPLVVLYEISVLLARIFERRRSLAVDDDEDDDGGWWGSNDDDSPKDPDGGSDGDADVDASDERPVLDASEGIGEVEPALVGAGGEEAEAEAGDDDDGSRASSVVAEDGDDESASPNDDSDVGSDEPEADAEDLGEAVGESTGDAHVDVSYGAYETEAADDAVESVEALADEPVAAAASDDAENDADAEPEPSGASSSPEAIAVAEAPDAFAAEPTVESEVSASEEPAEPDEDGARRADPEPEPVAGVEEDEPDEDAATEEAEVEALADAVAEAPAGEPPSAAAEPAVASAGEPDPPAGEASVEAVVEASEDHAPDAEGPAIDDDVQPTLWDEPASGAAPDSDDTSDVSNDEAAPSADAEPDVDEDGSDRRRVDDDSPVS